MPDGISCPCGASVTDPNAAVTYWTDAALDAILTPVVGRLKYLGVLSPFVGSVVNVANICAAPRVPQPEWSLSDFTNLGQAGIKAGQLLAGSAYDYFCTCDACPPATDCGQTDGYSVDQTSGYIPDPDSPYHRRYHIATGAELWLERGYDGFCLGLSNGVWIYWNSSDEGLTWSVNVRDGNDNAPGTSWSTANGGVAVTIYPAGVQVTPDDPIPEPPAGLDDWYGPPACSSSDICTALEYVREAVRRIEFLTTVIAGPTYGVTAPIDVTIPGLTAPLTGTLAEVLGRALTALAPIQATQMVDPVTVEITEATVVDVTGQAYANIQATVIPAAMGFRGSGDTTVYYSNHRTPGPGWVVILGDSGVLGHHEILYPDGLELVLPSTATALAVQVSAGVTVEVTTWQRSV